MLQPGLLSGPSVVMTYAYGEVNYILFWLFMKPYKVLLEGLCRFGRMNMAHNICILPLNRGLLSVKGHLVSVFVFGGHTVPVATTQHSHLSIKTATDHM